MSILLPVLLPGDLPVGQRDQRLAASAHADGDGLQRGALEMHARGLAMLGTAYIAQLAERAPLELFDPLVRGSRRGEDRHKSILA